MLTCKCSSSAADYCPTRTPSDTVIGTVFDYVCILYTQSFSRVPSDVPPCGWHDRKIQKLTGEAGGGGGTFLIKWSYFKAMSQYGCCIYDLVIPAKHRSDVTKKRLRIQRHHWPLQMRQSGLFNCVMAAEKGRRSASCRLIDLFSAPLFSAHISPPALQGALTLSMRRCWHFLWVGGGGCSLSL